LEQPQTTYDLEASLDHLASVVRKSLDMGKIYDALGFKGCCTQASLFYKL
jgi:hypothetical protein